MDPQDGNNLKAIHSHFCHFIQKAGHNSGSFYILSRAAMKIFAERLYHDEQACPFDELEDVGIAR